MKKVVLVLNERPVEAYVGFNTVLEAVYYVKEDEKLIFSGILTYDNLKELENKGREEILRNLDLLDIDLLLSEVEVYNFTGFSRTVIDRVVKHVFNVDNLTNVYFMTNDDYVSDLIIRTDMDFEDEHKGEDEDNIWNYIATRFSEEFVNEILTGLGNEFEFIVKPELIHSFKRIEIENRFYYEIDIDNRLALFIILKLSDMVEVLDNFTIVSISTDFINTTLKKIDEKLLRG